MPYASPSQYSRPARGRHAPAPLELQHP